MKRAAVLVLLFAGCAAGDRLDTLGLRLKGETDPPIRLALVQKLLDSGDLRVVPLLLDALQTVVDRVKPPDPDYTTNYVDPHTRGPELWGLIITTGQDFKRDIPAWREWWARVGPTLRWDGGQKRFVPQ